MADEEVHAFFMRMRWGPNAEHEQVCPSCGVINRHHYKRTRKQWVCKDCGHTFSLTSGTILADRKVPLRKLLETMVLWSHSTKGMSASQLSRSVGLSMKTMFVLLHKLRAGLFERRDASKLSGFVQLDGGHFSGKRRKPRKKKKATGRQLRDKMYYGGLPPHPNRRIVMVLRECSKPDAGRQRAHRTVVAVVPSEHPAHVLPLALETIERDSLVWSDEHPAYADFAAHFDHATVNHASEFSTDEGVNNNQAESFFARARRFQIGQIHRLTPKYMWDYAQEMAWREDCRLFASVRDVLEDLCRKVFRARPSQWWQRYWQGNNRPYELLFTGPPA